MSNTATSMSIFASVGFRQLEISAYNEGVIRLRPDIIVSPADIEYGKPTPGLKRKDKMDERTVAWVRGLKNQLTAEPPSRLRFSSLWPPVLPIEPEMQRSYLEYLEEQPTNSFGGISIYSTDSLPDIPKAFRSLPRLTLTQPSTPHDILTAISLGADLLTIPFITAASEAGMAMTFDFPPSSEASTSSPRLPLSMDLWSASHASTLEPLELDCPCYACTHHHRAYIHHLLNTKEMLAWVLLQLHNHHVMTEFFVGIRTSLQKGTFIEDSLQFRKSYASEFPPFTGKGPRIRGYHAASKGGDPKRNKAPYRKLEPDGEKGRRNGTPEMRHEGKEKVRESADARVLDDPSSDEDTGFDQLYDTEDRGATKKEAGEQRT